METLKNFEDLNELLLETIIESRNIEPLLENVCFHNNSSKWRLFFYMEQNALRCGTLSFLSTKLVKKVIQCGTHVSKKSHEILLKTYAEQRQVLVIVNLGDTILVTDNGMMTLLLNKINRFLTEDKLLNRRIDVDDFIVKFFGYKDHDTKDNIGNNFDKRKLVHKSVRTKIGNSNQNKNVSIKNIRKDSDESSKPTCVVPRRPHTATVVECDKSDIFKENLIICANPNDKGIYEKGLLSSYPRSSSEDERYPTQVTEVDAGLPSFEPHISAISSATRNSESAQTGFPNQGDDISFMHQAALRGSMVTSGSGLSFYSKPSRYTEYRDKKKRHESSTRQPIMLIIGNIAIYA